MLRLKRPFLGHSKVVSLLIGQRGELHTKLLKVQTSHFFVQVLGQEVHAQRVTLGVVPQLKRGTHHEAGFVATPNLEGQARDGLILCGCGL